MYNHHSVLLDKEKCIGCTDCIKRCPTEAIRVRNGKAAINANRCIDCGMCIRVCKSGAKQASTDELDMIHDFKYKVALPAPTFYTQFKGLRDPNVILTALKRIGFDEVFEVAYAAEVVTDYSTKLMIKGKLPRPVISSACPAIVKLIELRFPSLIPYVMPVISPKEAMARYAVNYLTKQGIKRSDIGIFFISPCPAKVTISRYPETFEKSEVDGILAIRDLYKKVLPIVNSMKKEEVEILQMASSSGVGWACSGGEGTASKIYNHIAVDGIDNVINVLERVEDGSLDVDFIECLACTNGCLGGPLTVENSFVAANRMARVQKYITTKGQTRRMDLIDSAVSLDWSKQLTNKQALRLDSDMEKALQKMAQIDQIYELLPKIDCGSCGAPTCRVHAEDIVQGNAVLEDCVFMLKEKIKVLADDMALLVRKKQAD